MEKPLKEKARIKRRCTAAQAHKACKRTRHTDFHAPTVALTKEF